MRSPHHFIIEAKETHKEKEGLIHIEHRFENQQKVKQFQPIVSVPKRFEDKVDVGDTLCVHFNTLRYEKDNSGKRLSKNHIDGDYYMVPTSQAHFIIKKDGEILFLQNEIIIEGKLGREEEITQSGIILPDLRNDYDKKKDLMNGTVYAKNSSITDLEVGDRVCMEPHSDYQIEFPDGKVRWLVRYSYLLFKYDK